MHLVGMSKAVHRYRAQPDYFIHPPYRIKSITISAGCLFLPPLTVTLSCASFIRQEVSAPLAKIEAIQDLPHSLPILDNIMSFTSELLLSSATKEILSNLLLKEVITKVFFFCGLKVLLHM